MSEPRGTCDIESEPHTESEDCLGSWRQTRPWAGAKKDVGRDAEKRAVLRTGDVAPVVPTTGQSLLGEKQGTGPSGPDALSIEEIRARAHAEGKAEGLDEAALEMERGSALFAGSKIRAERIRSLIPAGPEESK